MKKLPFIMFLFIASNYSAGQDKPAQDTLKLGEVVVSGSINDEVASIFSHRSFSQETLMKLQQVSAAGLLGSSGSIYLKQYGPGQLATTSYRGAGASGTMVTWNGIPVNSPMLGQADLSQFPLVLADNVSLFTGIASNAVSAGGIGATVDFSTKADWSGGTSALIATSGSSTGEGSGFIKISSGTSVMSSITRLYGVSSSNTFKYTDIYNGSKPFTGRMENAGFNSYGILQEFYVKNQRSVTSAKIWVHGFNRNIPGSLLVARTQDPPSQQDFNIRSLIKHDRYGKNGQVTLAVSYLSGKISYTDNTARISSVSNSHSFILRAGAETTGKRIKTGILINNQTDRVISENYQGIETRNVASATLTTSVPLSEHSGLAFLVRESIHDSKILIPDFSAGISSTRGPFGLRANISRSSRIPSLNDLFWNPGGNPDLKSESSWSGELTLNGRYKFQGLVEASLSSSFYASSVTNMIQWRPATSGYWSPENILSVLSRGAELESEIIAGKKGKSLTVSAHYSFTRAVNNSAEPGTSDNLQLVYVPLHLFASEIKAEYGRFLLSGNLNYTGKRFTVADNSEHLSGYFLADMFAAVKLGRKSRTELSVSVSNLFNTGYETVAYYAMPLRSYRISLLTRIAR